MRLHWNWWIQLIVLLNRRSVHSLQPHGLQHTRLSRPSQTPRDFSNSCPSSLWWLPPSHPLLSLSPRAFNLSQHQGLFQWVSASHQVAKVLEIQLQHQSLQRIFRFDFLQDGLAWSLAVQGTFKSLLQHYTSKASILQCSAFFIVRLSHPYMTIGKTIALTIWTFASKVMSLFFKMLARFVKVSLPRSKHLLI